MAQAATSQTAAGVAIPNCYCGQPGAFGYVVEGKWRWFCRAHRLRQWSADACISEAEAAHARAERFGFGGEYPPDLQELVAEHGGYDKITPKAWAEYDARMAAWQARRRGHVS
jgi:hypothetical protein